MIYKLKKIFGVLLILLYFNSCQTSPTKPELRGEGPLAVQINDKIVGIPEYHNPIETWRIRHMNEINDGNYLQKDCFICHEARTSCNNCHDYVGVVKVTEPFLPTNYHPEKNSFQALIKNKPERIRNVK
ncbi:MAG: hypothetical protein HW421_4106 [Ignavibacteria bacterium]|nr:hypothetical protein [Ignavibacteria bacterium]